MGLKICKKCHQAKPYSEFYLKGHYVNGTYYVNYSTSCKTCYIAYQNEYIKKRKEQLRSFKKMNYNKGADICETVYSPRQIHKNEELTKEQQERENIWIYGLLKRYGNCFINKSRKISKAELEKKLNKKIRIKPYENGYILEVAS